MVRASNGYIMSNEINDRQNGRDVEYSDGKTEFEGYIVSPRKAGSSSACILLAHDWSGLTEPTKRLAHRYAGLGHFCFALDIYGKGVRGDPLGDNTPLMSPFMDDRALLRDRLLAGYAAARRLPGVDDTRMAAVGYCFGGLCALDLARAGPPNLKAAVSFHGGLRSPMLESPNAIDASILILHGWEDPFVPPEDVEAIAAELTSAGADWQIHAYGHAMHAFTFEQAKFPDRGIAYEPTADKRSWAAMRSHLETALSA